MLASVESVVECRPGPDVSPGMMEGPRPSRPAQVARAAQVGACRSRRRVRCLGPWVSRRSGVQIGRETVPTLPARVHCDQAPARSVIERNSSSAGADHPRHREESPCATLLDRCLQQRGAKALPSDARPHEEPRDVRQLRGGSAGELLPSQGCRSVAFKPRDRHVALDPAALFGDPGVHHVLSGQPSAPGRRARKRVPLLGRNEPPQSRAGGHLVVLAPTDPDPFGYPWCRRAIAGRPMPGEPALDGFGQLCNVYHGAPPQRPGLNVGRTAEGGVGTGGPDLRRAVSGP